MSSEFVWDILFYILPFINIPRSLAGWQCVVGLCHLSETWLKLPIRGIEKDKYQEPYTACSRSCSQPGESPDQKLGLLTLSFICYNLSLWLFFFSNLLFLIRFYKFTTDCPQISPYNLSLFIPFRLSWDSVYKYICMLLWCFKFVISTSKK